MSTQRYPVYDVIVVGSGMGGLTTASLLARDGFRVLVLEASHLPGGCSSSYSRKGFVFESGATTLIGFDENQPLVRLEKMLGITLPKEPIDPPMTVRLNGEVITRFSDREKWIAEAVRAFGNEPGQRRFWGQAFRVSDTVWRISDQNVYFPPQGLREWVELVFRNRLSDLPVLRYAFRSVYSVMRSCGVDTPAFRSFIDEQLMITAQSKSGDTPFLFGAPGLTYTSSTNYYVPGGLLKMVQALEEYIRSRGGEVRCRSKVVRIQDREEYLQEKYAGAYVHVTESGIAVSQDADVQAESDDQVGAHIHGAGDFEAKGSDKVPADDLAAGVAGPDAPSGSDMPADATYVVSTTSSRFFTRKVVTNLPVWNLPALTSGERKAWFEEQAARFRHAWGAFVMGIAVKDTFPDDLTLHHQIHLDRPMPHTGAGSLFVSISARGDTERAPEGYRVLNLSCHTETDTWFGKPEEYDRAKAEAGEAVLDILESGLPGFSKENVQVQYEGTPVTWQNWVNRHRGRVGGIPQSMKRSLLDWPPAQPPFEGWYLTGDTVYPGQGIPGVTLGGINAYWRVVREQSRTGISRE
jgi:phytoene dehydrogenase-like protein